MKTQERLPELRRWLPKYKKWSLLPELLEFLGEEKFEEFIQVFGGLTVVLPTPHRWNQWLRNLRIYKRLNQGSSYQVTKSLADHYDLSPERVRHIHMEVRAILEEGLKD